MTLTETLNRFAQDNGLEADLTELSAAEQEFDRLLEETRAWLKSTRSAGAANNRPASDQ